MSITIKRASDGETLTLPDTCVELDDAIRRADEAAKKAENRLEAENERRRKVEHLCNRATSEAAVHRSFTMKVAARKTDPAILARDADTLLETGPGEMADKMLNGINALLVVLEKAKAIDAAKGTALLTAKNELRKAIEAYQVLK